MREGPSAFADPDQAIERDVSYDVVGDVRRQSLLRKASCLPADHHTRVWAVNAAELLVPCIVSALGYEGCDCRWHRGAGSLLGADREMLGS